MLEKPTWKNVVWSGLATGLAMLLKFSLVLIVPIFGLILAGWVWSMPRQDAGARWKHFFSLIWKTVVSGLVGIILIWAVYAYFIYNEPQAKQLADANFIIGSYPSKTLANLDLALIKNDFTRPLGQYVLGVLMVSQRAGGGNTAFFRGEVSNMGWRSYFPLLYLYKEPLALHLLTLLALWLGLNKIFTRTKLSFEEKKLSLVRSWIFRHLPEFSGMVMIVVYWASSVTSPLNLGIRHVLPTFPFIYLLVSRQITDWLKIKFSGPAGFLANLKNLFKIYFGTGLKYLFVAVLMIWLVVGTWSAFPHFLSYYNALAGGTADGYKIAVDSNYDWGQDLLRLKKFVEDNDINEIHLDYFGGGSPGYYLGEKFMPWRSSKGYVSGWYAVSSGFREQAFGRPVPGFNRGEDETYSWLKPYEPVARAGYTIWIYRLPQL